MSIIYFGKKRILKLSVFFLFIFIFLYEYPLNAQNAKLSQITLLVDNIQRSIDFYQRLGFTIVHKKTYRMSEGKVVIGADKLPLTADPKIGKYVIMRGNSDDSSSLGLLAYEKPPLASARGNLMGLGVGDVLLVVNTEDISFISNRLDEFGARFFSRLKKADTVEVSDDDTIYNLLVYDPDGRLIEVISKINN